MEIFQIIWSNLTTKNPNLITIIIIPLTLLEVFISMLIFTTLLNITTTKKQKLLYVILVSIFNIISRLIIPNPYNTYANLVFILLCIIYIYKTTILKSILALVIPFIFAILVESIFSKIYFIIFNIDYVTGMNIPLHRFLGTFIIYFIMYGIYYLIKISKINLSKIQILDKKKNFLLLFNIFFCMILIGSQLYILTYYTYSLPTFITLVNILSIFTYIIISFYTILTVSKLETTTINLEEAKLYNKTLEILQDNTRAFRHDFSNILQGMAGYMDTNDMEGLKKYYSQLVDDIQHSNNLSALSPKVVNNPAIYNILVNKYHKADSLGIKIYLESFIDMNELNIKIYEFTRILGILMDNAIEAASECDNKIINVSFRKDTKKQMHLLIIENTYKDKNINTTKIFEKGYSTKEGNTGLGLWEIRQILRKNSNLNLFTNKNSEFFTQQFEIFYK